MTRLPGLRPTLGFSLAYLGALVLVPLGALVVRAAEVDLPQALAMLAAPRTLAALRLSFSVALAAALASAVLGTLIAWVLARYEFPLRGLLDALVDIPFALPTSVAGIALTFVYAEQGWLGGLLAPVGVKVAFAPLGIGLALMFVGLPFVIRTVEPVVEELDPEVEEAARSLGASRAVTLRSVLLPEIAPSVFTGFALAFARGVGEYGSALFIAGNMPMKTEIAPLLIVSKLEQFDYAGAAVIATTMLTVSLVVLLLVQGTERYVRRRFAAGLP